MNLSLVLRHMVSLEKLHLVGCPQLSNALFEKQAGVAASDSSGVLTVGSCLPSLRHLTVGCCSELGVRHKFDCEALLSTLPASVVPKLQTLRIFYQYPVKKLPAQKMHTLKILDLRGARLSESLFPLNNLPHLHSLNLSGNNSLDPVLLRQFFAQKTAEIAPKNFALPKLQVLDVGGLVLPTDFSIVCCSKSLAGSLKKLGLAGCRAISARGVAPFADALDCLRVLPKLEVIDVESCRLVSEQLDVRPRRLRLVAGANDDEIGDLVVFARELNSVPPMALTAEEQKVLAEARALAEEKTLAAEMIKQQRATAGDHVAGTRTGGKEPATTIGGLEWEDFDWGSSSLLGSSGECSGEVALDAATGGGGTTSSAEGSRGEGGNGMAEEIEKESVEGLFAVVKEVKVQRGGTLIFPRASELPWER